MAERRSPKPQVGGSIPSWPANRTSCTKSGDPTDWVMSSETVNVKFDLVKMAIAVLIVAAAVVGFYVYEDQSTPLRVAGLLAATGIAAWIGLQTEPGRTWWNFVRDAQVEVRKVVWPTRQETTQTTLLVIAVVILAALILWGLDSVLGWAIRQVIGGPGG